MRLQERMKDMRDETKLRMLDTRLERADRDRERLRSENDALRSRLETADEERERWLSTIEGIAKRPSDGRKHRVRGLFVLATAAASAYVLGAKAGRARYEQIRARWAELRGRPDSDGDRLDGRAATQMSGGEDLVAEGSTVRPAIA